MEGGDDCKWRLHCQEDGDDHDEHHGGGVGVPLPPVPRLLGEAKDGHPPEG